MDPVTQEIIHGKLLATADEMGIVMARTSMSPVIYEVLDFACGICAPSGDLIAQTNGITLFTGTFSAQIGSLIERFGADVHEGDLLLTNDPYRGGTHSCDFALVRPVFFDGAIIAYAINVAHYIDVGGAAPGSLPPDATSVFQEGLRMSCIRIARDDRFLPDMIRIIEENVRFPEIVMGDLNAQAATLRIADARIREVARKYGPRTLAGTIEALLDASESSAREMVQSLPEGSYEATDVIDGDGVTDTPIPLKVAVTIANGRIVADFTGCPAAVAGPINCSRGALNSAVKTVFKALVAPNEPSNEGWFRPLEVICPDGTLFTAQKPSPTGWYYEGSVHASELVWKALARLMPNRFSAGSYASLCATYISGVTRAGEPFVHIEPNHGGWGATRERDGASALIALTDGDTYNYSVELIETKFPLMVARYGFNVEGGVGAGKHRGGYGIVREYRMLADAKVYCGFGRHATAPWGVDEGREGSCNALEVVIGKTGEVSNWGRASDIAVSSGDVVRIVTGGGGGWGPASERNPEAVAADIRDGLLTEERAKLAYGRAGAASR